MKDKLHGRITRTLCFRFYEALNDFLPKERRNIIFPWQFTGTPSIKDAIEAIGVPHTEVDLIIVNGKSVGFNHLVYGGEYICVYPLFVSLDNKPVVHLGAKPLRESKFVVDVNLGKLASKLRLLGFDTLYRNDFLDSEIIKLSLREQRIILTRDKGILKYTAVTHGYWVRDNNPQRQLKEVVYRYQLHNFFRPLTRCSYCNAQLKPIDKAVIKERIPDDTWQYYNDFMFCSGCQKIYWKGSHYLRICKYIDELKAD